MKAYKAQTRFAIVFLAFGLLIFNNPFQTKRFPNSSAATSSRSQKERPPKERLLPDEQQLFPGESDSLPQTSIEALSIPNRLSGEELASFHHFVKSVINGNPEAVRGVFVPGVLALPVVQQPVRDATYVSTELGTVTEFRKAAENHVIGLLAHNFLSGALFFDLEKGQEVRIIYGDGYYDRYKISQAFRYQKTNPNGLKSDYIDLNSGKVYSTLEIFAKFYRGAKHITFQTCLQRNGLLNWGLLFVTAYPLNTDSIK